MHNALSLHYIPRREMPPWEALSKEPQMEHHRVKLTQKLTRRNLSVVKRLCPQVTLLQLLTLREISDSLHLSISKGELQIIEGKWYVTHSGLLRIAQRRRCAGIQIELEHAASTPLEGRWVFRATVHKSPSQTFVGYGDADPSNVSPLVHGAEMRIAETRAVNRALRKAYGIGICSIEELGSTPEVRVSSAQSRKPSQPVNGNYGSSKVRDRLCQLIRQHQLDPNLVKTYAVDFCKTKTLREATRDQVENFVAHLADWAEKDRTALLCQLNSYLPAKGSGA
jgi:hypothetical protein